MTGSEHQPLKFSELDCRKQGRNVTGATLPGTAREGRLAEAGRAGSDSAKGHLQAAVAPSLQEAGRRAPHCRARLPAAQLPL